LENEYTSLIREYREKFNEGPPVWGLDNKQAIKQMKEAIKTGKEMKGFDMSKLPPDSLL